MVIFAGMQTINCVGLITLNNRKLLLAFSNNKKAWYLPGGKVDAGETAVGALQREVKEELNVQLAETGIRWYYFITAPAWGENNVMMEQDCFLCRLPHSPEPTAEIGAVRYFSLSEYLQEEHQVPGVLMAFEKLRNDGLVD